MAEVYRRGRVWWVRFRADGQHVRRSARTEKKSDAQTFLLRLMEEHAAAARDVRPAHTYAEAVDRFFAETSIKARTKASYQSNNKACRPTLGSLRLTDINRRALADHISARKRAGVTDATIRRDLAFLSSVFSAAIRWEWVDTNPVTAISNRYETDGRTSIHVVDGGYQDTGDKLVEHINKYYGNPTFINHVVVTHNDGDHAAGVQTVLRSYGVGALWMLRPWNYAADIIHRFATYNSTDRLRSRLRSLFPNLAALEDLANELGIPIYEPFQGARIGAFTCLSPSRNTYFDLVVESDRTPEHVEEQVLASAADSLLGKAGRLVEKVVAFVAAAWGFEAFSPGETSNENEMSVVQYANLCGQKVLLTGDAGRRALGEAADYAPRVGLTLPGIDRFQIPHHGSRRNVSTELLDRWLGERLSEQPDIGNGHFTAIVSAAHADSHHPRRAVLRAMIHRGANIVSTESGDKRTGYNAPNRTGWVTAPYLNYPHELEE